jgi:hypothetical protein
MLGNFKFHKHLIIRIPFMKTNIHFFLSYLAQFFLEWEMLHTKVVEKTKTHFVQ